ncbi:MAG TPA: glycosyltransferase [Spirochaetota bacterium]|nr:glycosyltransferase [Spirochaetota bacterium]HPI88198.1 glycosyltransferase [Spirochaetota bacterium]HPR47257.1 glycosyltransferase [Spirochaetota bacterium]
MDYSRPFHNEIINLLDDFTSGEMKKYPTEDLLTIDLHCHDHNSDVPDEILGRILNIPETWLQSEDLIDSLKKHNCDTFTVTNHNNARSCYMLRDIMGLDILTGAEFSCMVPDFNTGIHVLTYGFTPSQEVELNRLRNDLYSFMSYTREHDIPTIWAHPLYHYHSKGIPPVDFFNKMALVFERFEVINGQRDSWQNMLVKLWVESLDREKIDALSEKYSIPPDRYCHNPYKKSMAGGSDSHMGVFSGLTGTMLYVPDLKEKLKIMPRSMLALDAIKKGNMLPFGSHNDSEKMTVSFLDYFCQVAMNIKDPGVIRLVLHKGETRDKVLAMLIANGLNELKRHKVTMNFLQLFHECFSGNVPGFTKKLFIPRVYRPIFNRATEMAEVKRDNPEETATKFKESIDSIYTSLNEIFFSRLLVKLEDITRKNNFESFDINAIFDSLEFPSQIRGYLENDKKKMKKDPGAYNSPHLNDFLDGLSFPFLASAVILSATYASARVMYNSRNLLNEFSRDLGMLQHPERMLWLTDTFEDNNGVAMVLRSMLDEIRERNLPIDILICSSTVAPEDHLIVVPPLFEFTFPFYEQQPLRVPNIMDIHNIFKEREYDRLICSTEGPMGFISLFLKSAYSVPAYFYVHTDWMMFARQTLNLDEHNLNRLRRIIRAYYRAFDGLFVLNNDQRKWLIGKDMGFDRSKVFLTAHWVDKFFTPLSGKKTELFGVEESSPVLLFAGRISHEKGVMELPAIYEKIKNDFPRAKMVIAGTGPNEKELKKALPEGIFLGWVDHDRIPEIYSAADMLLLPSKFDTFGCVVLEALSCGLPVTAYRTKGPKDIIIHNENGFLVKNKNEMASAVRLYLGDKKLQKSFKKAALKRAGEYDADLIIGRLLDDLSLGHLSDA